MELASLIALQIADFSGTDKMVVSQELPVGLVVSLVVDRVVGRGGLVDIVFKVQLFETNYFYNGKSITYSYDDRLYVEIFIFTIQ